MTALVGHQPWSVQIELTEGCTRLCSFCGLNGIRDAPGGFKRMEQATMDRIAKQCAELCPAARYEFAMHGEPLANPNYLALISTLRAHLPKAQIMVTTNGGPLMKNMQLKLERLFAIGVNFIVLDTYYPERDELRAEAAKLKRITVRDFYDELVPLKWSPYGNHRGRVNRLVVLMDDIGVRDGEHSTRVLHNHAGSNPLLPTVPEPLGKTCMKAFREVSICWDGEVRLCCEDWVGRYVCGNVNDKTLREIWYGDEFESARAHLHNKDRDFGACKVCDSGSGVRVGLEAKYPPITDDQRATVKEVGERTIDRSSATHKATVSADRLRRRDS